MNAKVVSPGFITHLSKAVAAPLKGSRGMPCSTIFISRCSSNLHSPKRISVLNAVHHILTFVKSAGLAGPGEKSRVAVGIGGRDFGVTPSFSPNNISTYSSTCIPQFFSLLPRNPLSRIEDWKRSESGVPETGPHSRVITGHLAWTLRKNQPQEPDRSPHPEPTPKTLPLPPKCPSATLPS